MKAKMKVIVLVLYPLIMVPIYVAPIIFGIGTAIDAIDAADIGDDPNQVSDQVVDQVAGQVAGQFEEGLAFGSTMWMFEAGCYLALGIVVAIFATEVRWVTALVFGAAVFDLAPMLNQIPLVPTIALVVGYIMIARAKKPQTVT